MKQQAGCALSAGVDADARVLNKPGTVIGGFCNSSVCLEPFK